jgi:acetyl esterase
MTPAGLEPEAQALLRALAGSSLHQLGPQAGRLALEKAQHRDGAAQPQGLDAADRSLSVASGGRIQLRILKPSGLAGPLPVILYLHGAGWVFGSAGTHDRLVRELALAAGAAVVFPVYSLAPEAPYPIALEECYAAARWVSEMGAADGLDPGRMVIAGDSVGGNLAAAVTLLAKQRNGPGFKGQLLLYPVTDASFDTASYSEFATGFGLQREAMRWFWDQYAPGAQDRALITVSPLRAGPDHLQGLPPALVITADADVLRDEGEAYAAKLRAAGVKVEAVRMLGSIHDFMMLNALAEGSAAKGGLDLAGAWLRRTLA